MRKRASTRCWMPSAATTSPTSTVTATSRGQRHWISCLMLSDGQTGPSFGTPQGKHDGNLDARTIMQRCRAGTDIIVLRACSSGVTNVRAGDEQEGILRALIHVGIATMIVARWKIDAPSSRELLRRFYHAWLVQRQPRAYALQVAQRSFLADPRHYLSHPFHWSPFVIVGGNRW